jgi:hypothetical protein
MQAAKGFRARQNNEVERSHRPMTTVGVLVDQARIAGGGRTMLDICLAAAGGGVVSESSILQEFASIKSLASV